MKTEKKKNFKTIEIPGAYVDVVSHLEGIQIDKNILEYLINYNDFDMRKTLLDLEFWNNSNDKHLLLRLNHESDLEQFWWNVSRYLSTNNDKNPRRPSYLKRKRGKSEKSKDSDECDESVRKKSKMSLENGLENFISNQTSKECLNVRIWELLDVASTLDLMDSTWEEKNLLGTNYRPKDSLSLEEKTEENFSSRQKQTRKDINYYFLKLSSEIMSNVSKCNLNDGRENDGEFFFPVWEDVRLASGAKGKRV